MICEREITSRFHALSLQRHTHGSASRQARRRARAPTRAVASRRARSASRVAVAGPPPPSAASVSRRRDTRLARNGSRGSKQRLMRHGPPHLSADGATRPTHTSRSGFTPPVPHTSSSNMPPIVKHILRHTQAWNSFHRCPLSLHRTLSHPIASVRIRRARHASGPQSQTWVASPYRFLG